MTPFEAKLMRARVLRRESSLKTEEADDLMDRAFDELPEGTVLYSEDGMAAYGLVQGTWRTDGLLLPVKATTIRRWFIDGAVALRDTVSEEG